MHTVNEIVEEAKRLTASDRRRLVAEMQTGLVSEEVNGIQAQRLAALDAWIAKAGTGQSSISCAPAKTRLTLATCPNTAFVAAIWAQWLRCMSRKESWSSL